MERLIELIFGTPWWLVLALAVYGVCAGLFTGLYKHELSRKRWIGYLIQNTWAKRYRGLLGNMLDWIDARLTPDIADERKKWKSDEARAAWSYGLLNLSLLLAVFYPILSVVVHWAVTNTDGRIGTLLLIMGGQPAPSRLAPICGIALAATFAILARRAEGHRRLVFAVVAYGLAAAAAASLTLAGAGAGAAALEAGFVLLFAGGFPPGAGAFVAAVALVAAAGFAAALALAAAVAGAGAFAAAAAFAAAVAFVAALEAAVAGAVATAAAFTTAAAFAGAGAFAQDWLGTKTGRPVLMLTLFAALLLAALAIALRLGERTLEQVGSVILFFVILPVLNALADFVSSGLTRWRLRKGLAGRMWKEMLIDLGGAAAIFFLLGAVSILAIDWMRWSDGSALFDLPGFFTDLCENPHDYWWLYFTLFSTLIPTVLHGSVALFGSMIHLWPWLRRFIVNGLDAGGRGDVVAGRLAVQALCLAMAVSVVAPVFVLGHLVVYRGIVGHALLDLFECFAQLVGAIPSP